MYLNANNPDEFSFTCHFEFTKTSSSISTSLNGNFERHYPMEHLPNPSDLHAYFFMHQASEKVEVSQLQIETCSTLTCKGMDIANPCGGECTGRKVDRVNRQNVWVDEPLNIVPVEENFPIAMKITAVCKTPDCDPTVAVGDSDKIWYCQYNEWKNGLFLAPVGIVLRGSQDSIMIMMTLRDTQDSACIFELV